MTDYDADLTAIDDAARSLLPELGRRLSELGLGELEVRRGALRLKVAARRQAATRAGAPRDIARDTVNADAAAMPATPGGDDDRSLRQPVVSPAVGIFVYADGLGPGLEVTPGQTVGHVDMLGVQHDVRAQRGGRIASLVTESGEPVEYGQLLLEIEGDEVRRR
ncbi:MAG: acetyl-CoA carboxylase biotin carboxyl carrier protein subunit [Candidatus Limnocylindria bacterium]